MAGSAQRGVAWHNVMEILGSSEAVKSYSPGDGSVDNFMFKYFALFSGPRAVVTHYNV